MQRRYYNSKTLAAELRGFEKRHGISTEEFIALRARDEEPESIPNFDCAVWSATYHEFKRMEAEK